MVSGQGSHWLIESPTMFIYLCLHIADPGRAWAENNLNTSGLGRTWPLSDRALPGRACAGPGHNKNIDTKPRLLIYD